MTIECLCSDKIVRERTGRRAFVVRDKANFFSIKNRRLAQFSVNPIPLRKMREIPEGTRIIEIEYHEHMHNVRYSARCLDRRGNDLKTYEF